MKVKKVIIEGFHNVDRKVYEFDSINYLYGRNGVGKSTVLQAVQLGLLGYVPGSNKTVKGTWSHSNSRSMSITVELDDNGDFIEIQRIWENGKSIHVKVSPEGYDVSSLVAELELPLFNFDEFTHLTANKLKEWFINYLPMQIFTTDWNSELSNSIKSLPNGVVDNKLIEDSIEAISQFHSSGVEEIRQANNYFKTQLSFMKKELERKNSTIQSLIHYDDYVEVYSEDELKQMIKNTENAIIQSRLALQSRNRIKAIQKELAILENASRLLEDATERYQLSEIELNESSKELDTLESDYSNVMSEYRSYDSVVNSQGVCPYTKSLCDEISTLRDSHIEKQRNLKEVGDSYSAKIIQVRSRVSVAKDKYDRIRHDIMMFENDVRRRKQLEEELSTLTLDSVVPDIDALESQLESYKDMYGKAVANKQYNELNDVLVKDKYRIENTIDCLKLWVKLTDVNGLQSSNEYDPFELLSDSINHVLTNLLGSTAAVKFNSENKANSFSFGIVRESTYVPYNLLSSGEKCIFILSMYIGLLEYTKSPLKLILIDDFLDHLDNENFENVFKLLEQNTENQYILAGVKPISSDSCNIIKIVA